MEIIENSKVVKNLSNLCDKQTNKNQRVVVLRKIRNEKYKQGRIFLKLKRRFHIDCQNYTLMHLSEIFIRYVLSKPLSKLKNQPQLSACRVPRRSAGEIPAISTRAEKLARQKFIKYTLKTNGAKKVYR